VDQYRLIAYERDGQWVAHAERVDSGDRFGVELTGASEAEALDNLRRWLDWQSEHAAALHALQEAQHEYHRIVADHAFGDGVGDSNAVQLERESLEYVDAARARLDEVRARKPL
jgi:hypothetical protein